MGNVSNSMLLDEIDFIAAVVKAQAESYTATVDAYDIMVREQNPDDLLNGVDAAVSLRTTLSDMTSLYGQFSQMAAWFNARAVSAGSSALDALLTARGLRVPYSYDRYVYYPSSGHLTQANIFYDTEVVLGWMKQNLTFSAMDDLPLSGTYNWLALKVGVTNTGDNWTLTPMSVYADDSTGTSYVFIPSGAAQDTLYNVGETFVQGLSKAGQNVAAIGTTGMAAGQKVLMHDPTIPALMATGANSGQAKIYVSPDQLGWYDTGDHLWIRDSTPYVETGIIEDMDWQNGVITMRSNLAKSYTVAQDAYIYKATGTAGMDGWTEMHTIASVSNAYALAFSASLQHTYFTGGAAVRLIKDVFDVGTSGGTTADIVWVVTKSERAISQ